MMNQEPYDKKFLYWCLGTFCAMCALMKVSGGALYMAFIPAIMAALLQRKTEKLLFWLLASTCLFVVNYWIAPKGIVFALSQRALLVTMGVCMSAQVFGRRTHRVLSPYMGVILYIVYMVVPSALGWCPIVSFLKLFLFTVIYFSLFGSVNLLGIDQNVSSRRVRSIMLCFAIFFLFGSVALIPFPGISQMKLEAYLEAQARGVQLKSLFAGMSTHSQCLGPVVSSIGVVLLGDLLFSIKRPHKLYIALLATCPILLYKTSSRTGMGAFLLGVTFVVYLFMQARGMPSRWKSKVMSAAMIIFSVLMMAVLMMPKFQQGIKNFTAKSGDAGTVTVEGVISSRMGLIEHALYNFHRSPMIGNGFQVGDTMVDFEINDIKKILSAPIEKGVWIVAVLEEGGVFGWLIFVGVFAGCILVSMRNRAYIGAAGMFTCLMTNLGEFTMFSMSYSGGFVWSMIFMGLALDIRRNKDEQGARFGIGRPRLMMPMR